MNIATLSFRLRSFAYLLTCGAASVCLVGVSNAAAAPVSQIYSFGDSRVDVGTLNLRYTSKGSLWIEYLSNALGKNSAPARSLYYDANGNPALKKNNGNNYAIGGATTAPNSHYWSLKDEMDNFFTDHPKINKNDLFFIWTGENDLSSQSTSLSYTPNDISTFVAGYKTQLDRLRAAGARNIVAFSLPVNLQPLQALADVFESQGADPAAAKSYVTAYSKQVAAQELATRPLLRAEGVYVIDFNKLAEAVISKPGKFGFTNTIDNYMGRGVANAANFPEKFPNDGNVYSSNPPHFSDAMHRLIADYTTAQLRARDQIFGMMLQEATINQVRSNSVQEDFEAAFDHASNTSAGLILTAFGDAAGARQEATGGFDSGSRTTTKWGGVRIDQRLGEAAAFSTSLAVGDEKGKFDQSTGGYHSVTTALQIMGVYKLSSRLTLSGAMASNFYNLDDFNRRSSLASWSNFVDVENAHGKTKGQYYTANIAAKYRYSLLGWSQQLGVGAQWWESRVNAFQETGGLLALAYGKSSLEDIDVKVGWSAEKIAPVYGWRPFASTQYIHDLRKKDYKVAVGPSTDLIVDYGVPRPGSESLSLSAGAETTLTPSNRLRLGTFIQGVSGKRANSISGFRLSLDHRF